MPDEQAEIIVPLKRYHIKLFCEGGLGIEMVTDYTSIAMWDKIREAQASHSIVAFMSFDHDEEEVATAIVTVEPGNIKAVVQRDLDSVRKQQDAIRREQMASALAPRPRIM